MRLRVTQATTYRYSEPIAYAIRMLRMTPQPYEGLVVTSWRVHGGARRELPAFTDGYGNTVHGNSIDRPHQGAIVAVEGMAETRDTGGRVRGAPETLPPGFYLRTTPPTRVATGQAAGLAAGKPGTLDWAERLMDAVRATLENGAGLCQDRVHLFIAACRRAGVPARAVCGYLWSEGTGGSDDGSHVWAETFLHEIGWVGFDPSIPARAGDRHLRVAIGLDCLAAAPVRGVWRGSASGTMDVTISVSVPAGEQ
jgi:transglutaminase-like putative cysteine protease